MTKAEELRGRMPRTDSSEADIVEAFTTLMYVLGERGRGALREALLSNAESKAARDCLTVMNDVERVMEWKKRQPPDALSHLLEASK